MKIFSLFSSLSKEELKLLRKAVGSPLFNTNEQLPLLFELLRRQHPHFEDSIAARRKLFKKLWPKKPFSEPKLLQLLSNLTKVIEQLLLYLDQEKQPLKKQQRLATIYSQRQLNVLSKNEIATLNLKLTENPQQSISYHQKKFEVLSQQYFHPLHDKYIQGDETLNLAHHHLDIYYALNKLRLTIASKSKNQLIQEAVNYMPLQGLEVFKDKAGQPDHLLLGLYIQSLALFEATTDFDFEKYAGYLFQNLPNLEIEDQQFLYTTGLNYVIKQKNKGTTGFQQTLFNWFKYGIETRLLIINEVIIEPVFANIVIIGCQERAFEWVEQFIEHYKQYLPKKELDNAIAYYQSLVSYAQGDWDKTLECFFKDGHKTVFKPRARIIINKALFEKFVVDNSYWEVLMASLASFERYLNRNNYFTPERLSTYKKFIKTTKQLAKRINAGEKILPKEKGLAEKG